MDILLTKFIYFVIILTRPFIKPYVDAAPYRFESAYMVAPATYENTDKIDIAGDATLEYEECLSKASAILKVLQS